MSLRLINFNVPRIEKPVAVHGFRGSGLNENPPARRRAGVNLEPVNTYE